LDISESVTRCFGFGFVISVVDVDGSARDKEEKKYSTR
jgi:hypothetical protein